MERRGNRERRRYGVYFTIQVHFKCKIDFLSIVCARNNCTTLTVASKSTCSLISSFLLRLSLYFSLSLPSPLLVLTGGIWHIDPFIENVVLWIRNEWLGDDLYPINI
jgi:hypothetical protein